MQVTRIVISMFFFSFYFLSSPDELSEMVSAMLEKDRIGRQELFQSRFLHLSVVPKHEDFINFIR